MTGTENNTAKRGQGADTAAQNAATVAQNGQDSQGAATVVAYDDSGLL